MKKILTIMMVLLLVFSITACGSQNGGDNPQNDDPKDEVQYADDAFIKDFSDALCARWDYKPDYVYESGTVDHFNYFTELVQIERDILSKYRTETFKNTELSNLANEYLDGLDKQDKSLSYLLSAYDTYREMWTKARDERALCIKKIYDAVDGFEVPSKYDDILHHMLTSANIAQNANDVYTMLNAPIKNGEYTIENSTLKMSIKNTCGFEFRNYTFYSDFYNGSTYVAYGQVHVDSWKPDEVYEFEFTFDSSVSYNYLEITAE